MERPTRHLWSAGVRVPCLVKGLVHSVCAVRDALHSVMLVHSLCVCVILVHSVFAMLGHSLRLSLCVCAYMCGESHLYV